MSDNSGQTSQFQPYIDAVGSLAQSPKPAYALAATFALAAPFCFPGGRDNRIPAPVTQSPLGRVARGKLGTAPLRALPPFWQVAGFAAIFAGGGYIIDQGDSLNGAGTVTAWSLTYLFFNGLSTIRRPGPLSALLLLSSAGLGAGVHGCHYFSQTSWKGAVPGLSPSSSPSSTHSKPSQAAVLGLGLGLSLAKPRGSKAARAPFFGRKKEMRMMRHFTTSAAARLATKAERFAKPINPAHLPQGFAVAATYAGIKAAISPSPSKSPAKTPKPDLALITTAVPVAAAGTFTKNAFKAAPVVLSSNLLLEGASSANGARAKSVLVNSGCANAVTGKAGYDDASRCASLVSELLPAENQEDNKTLLLSTGVIGVPLPMKDIQAALPRIADKDRLNNSEQNWWEVARAFMTTDTFPKLRAKTFHLGGRKCGIVGIDKGAGMIHPAMTGPQATTGAAADRPLHATLLGLVCTDAPISPTALQSALEHAMTRSFNCISVDGDMSTNDTVIALASGLAPTLPDADGGELALEPGEEITEEGHPEEYAQFVEELTTFCKELSHLIVRDGEGAEKFVEIEVRGAPTYEHAHRIASSISTSSLVKCALHGSDANWGRILCAVGYTDLPVATATGGKAWAIDPLKVNVQFLPRSGQGLLSDAAVPGALVVLQDGAPVGVDEQEAAKLLGQEDIFLRVDLQGGNWGPKDGAKESATYWTCDLSKEYVAVSLQIASPFMVALLLIYADLPHEHTSPQSSDQWRLQDLTTSLH